MARKAEIHVGREELTIDELKRVATTAKGEMRILIAIGIYTGLRISDAATLQWGNVDLDRGYISLMPRKTRKHGTYVRIPIHPALHVLLSAIDGDHTGPVMPGICEEHLTKKTVGDKVQRLFENCGIQTTKLAEGRTRRSSSKTFHSLRHTFVSLCANSGVPLAVVQEIVGHKSTAMTQHYAHISDAALQGAIRSLPEIESGKVPRRIAMKTAPAEAQSARLSTLLEIINEMDATELDKAAKILRAQIAAKHKELRAKGGE